MTQSDFKGLDTYLNSEEFIKAYNKAEYKHTGNSCPNNPDHSGMMVEDLSELPVPERYYISKLN